MLNVQVPYFSGSQAEVKAALVVSKSLEICCIKKEHLIALNNALIGFILHVLLRIKSSKQNPFFRASLLRHN